MNKGYPCTGEGQAPMGPYWERIGGKTIIAGQLWLVGNNVDQCFQVTGQAQKLACGMPEVGLSNGRDTADKHPYSGHGRYNSPSVPDLVLPNSIPDPTRPLGA